MAHKPLTYWRAKKKKGIISKLETQQCTVVTHILEGQQKQALWTCLKHSKAQQTLIFWRAKIRNYQQVWKKRHSSHSPTGESKTGIVSRLERWQDMAATHILKSQGYRLLTCLKCSKHNGNLPTKEPRTSIVSMLERQWSTSTTHRLDSQEHALLKAWNTVRYNNHSHPEEPKIVIINGLKNNKAQQLLTY